MLSIHQIEYEIEVNFQHWGRLLPYAIASMWKEKKTIITLTSSGVNSLILAQFYQLLFVSQLYYQFVFLKKQFFYFLNVQFIKSLLICTRIKIEHFWLITWWYSCSRIHIESRFLCSRWDWKSMEPISSQFSIKRVSRNIQKSILCIYFWIFHCF